MNVLFLHTSIATSPTQGEDRNMISSKLLQRTFTFRDPRPRKAWDPIRSLLDKARTARRVAALVTTIEYRVLHILRLMSVFFSFIPCDACVLPLSSMRLGPFILSHLLLDLSAPALLPPTIEAASVHRPPFASTMA